MLRDIVRRLSFKFSRVSERQVDMDDVWYSGMDPTPNPRYHETVRLALRLISQGIPSQVAAELYAVNLTSEEISNAERSVTIREAQFVG